MATKRATKSKASSKAKATPRKPAAAKLQAPTAAQLRVVIEQLIEAKQSGDYAAGNQAAAALAAINKLAVAPRVQRAAAEAHAVAAHPVMVDSLRLLKTIAAGLRVIA